MSSVAIIRAQVERRVPGALTVYERSAPEVFSTGIPDIERESGGIPKGALAGLSAKRKKGIVYAQELQVLKILGHPVGTETDPISIFDKRG